MLNLNRRSIAALQDSTNSIRRSTAAKQKATQSLLDLLDEDLAPSDAGPRGAPPRPGKLPPRKG